MSDGKEAEQLWLKAHEEVKKGNLAQAVRDLAKCYEMLKALKDPRLAQVHRRWVEVHKLYQARKAKAAAALQQQGDAAQAQAAARARAEAEAKARAEAEAKARAEAEAKARAEAEAKARAEAEAQARAAAEAQAREAVVADPGFGSDAGQTLEQRAESAANAGDLAGAAALYQQVVQEQPGNELARERLAELQAAQHHAQSFSQPPAAAGGGGVDGKIAFLEELLGRVQENKRAV